MATDILKARCGKCQSRLRIPAAWLRQIVRCTRCGAAFRVKPRTTAHEQPAAIAPPVAVPTSEALDPGDHNFFADLAVEPNTMAFTSGATYRPTNSWAGWTLAGIVLFAIISSGFV